MTGPAPDQPVEDERHGSVVLLWLNRPASRNAFDLAMMRAFGTAISQAAEDDTVSVVVLAARGLSFSAGVDIKAYAAAMASPDGPGEMNEAAQAGASAPQPGPGVLIREQYAKPVICAVQGPALGLGCELVLASDIVVASEQATFGLPEVRHGLAPSGGATVRLLRQLPWSRAMWMLLSGEALDAVSALRYGLVTRLTEPGQSPAEAALGMASVIAGHSQLAVRETKALAMRSIGRSDEDAQGLGDDVMNRMSASAEATGRMQAFSDSRKGSVDLTAPL
jgi:enoyl-CoA hydratase